MPASQAGCEEEEEEEAGDTLPRAPSAGQVGREGCSSASGMVGPVGAGIWTGCSPGIGLGRGGLGSEWGALGSPGWKGRSGVPAPVVQFPFPPSRWTGGPTDPLAHVPLGPSGTFASPWSASLGPCLTPTPGGCSSRSAGAPVQCWGSSPGCCVQALVPDPKCPGCNGLRGPTASSSLCLPCPGLCSSMQCPPCVPSGLSTAHAAPRAS